jgi:uncharacterized membrane protein
MTNDAKGRGGGGTGLLEGLKSSPATKQLTEQARGLVSAHADRLTHGLGERLTSVTGKLGEIGETGKLPPMAEAGKRMLAGDGALKSAAGAATSGIGEKVKGLVGKLTGKSGKGGGKGKAMNIEESIDIGVPVATAYNQWTQFQDFSRFMKGVESVEQTSDTETTWRAKVFKSRRTWKATIQEQVPDSRIVWTSEGGKGSTKGVVTFHALGDDLTRVLLALEYYPSGVVEKTGNLWRAAGRRARLDLKNFRRFVMMEGQETGAWRGEIRDGKVTEQPDEQPDDQGDEQPDDQPDEQQSKADSGDDGSDRRSARRERRPRGAEREREDGKRRPAKKTAAKKPAKKTSATK